MIQVYTPLPTLTPTYLETDKPSDNLDKLSNSKYSAGPSSACVTQEVYRQVPYFKPSHETIRNTSIGLISTIAIGSFAGRIFNKTLGCAFLRQNELDKNFFPIAAECLAKSYNSMGQPSAKLLTFSYCALAILISSGCFVAAKLFLTDYKEKTRLDLLNKEYSEMAGVLHKSFENAKNQQIKSKNNTALLEVENKAKRLQANLQAVRSNLIKAARLDPKEADLLLIKLSHVINEILSTARTS